MEQQPPFDEDSLMSGIPIDVLVEQLSSPDPDTVAAATDCLADYLSSQRGLDQYADAIIESEALDLLIGIISPATTASDDTVANALVVICNITGGTSMQAHAVVEAGAIPQILRHLDNPNLDIVDGAVWALANIAAADNLSFAPLLIDGGVLERVPDLLKRKLMRDTLDNIAWLMSNLVRQTLQVGCCSEMFRSFVSIIGQLSRLEDLDRNSSVLYAIVELTDEFAKITGPSRYCDFQATEILQVGSLIPFIVRCLDVPELAVSAAFVSIRLIDNDQACLTMVNEGIVPKLIREAYQGNNDVARQVALFYPYNRPSLLASLIEDWDLFGQMLALAQERVEPDPDSDSSDEDYVKFHYHLAEGLYTALLDSSRPVAHHIASIGWIPQLVRWAQTITLVFLCVTKLLSFFFITSPRWKGPAVSGLAGYAIICIDILLEAEPLHPGERPLNVKVKEAPNAVVAMETTAGDTTANVNQDGSIEIITGSVDDESTPAATSQQQPPPSLPPQAQSDNSQDQPPDPQELDIAKLVAAECNEALLSKILMHLPSSIALKSTITTWIMLEPRWAEHSTPTDPS